MNVSVTLTWSKIMAFTILACAMVLDILQHNSTAFMFSVPFVSALIIGKQYFDRGREFPIQTEKNKPTK